MITATKIVVRRGPWKNTEEKLVVHDDKFWKDLREKLIKLYPKEEYDVEILDKLVSGNSVTNESMEYVDIVVIATEDLVKNNYEKIRSLTTARSLTFIRDEGLSEVSDSIINSLGDVL